MLLCEGYAEIKSELYHAIAIGGFPAHRRAGAYGNENSNEDAESLTKTKRNSNDIYKREHTSVANKVTLLPYVFLVPFSWRVWRP